VATALEESLGKRLSADAVAKFRAGLLKALPSDSIDRGAKLFFQCKGGVLSIAEGYAARRPKRECPPHPPHATHRTPHTARRTPPNARRHMYPGLLPT
jgi:hypothetical protein